MAEVIFEEQPHFYSLLFSTLLVTVCFFYFLILFFYLGNQIKMLGTTSLSLSSFLLYAVLSGPQVVLAKFEKGNLFIFGQCTYFTFALFFSKLCCILISGPDDFENCDKIRSGKGVGDLGEGAKKLNWKKLTNVIFLPYTYKQILIGETYSDPAQPHFHSLRRNFSPIFCFLMWIFFWNWETHSMRPLF